MGVQGLWRVLESTAKPVQLANLRGKVLAIDASIWIYHFLKAMRDSKGTILAAAHIIGFFRRICKLLFFEIRPVFVFDGAAPLLKKQTTQKRGERRQGREVNARATANKLLTLQLQRAAQQEKQNEPSQAVKVTGSVPAGAVYMDDVGRQPEDRGASNPANFVKMDQYHLPELSKIAPVSSTDQRMLTEDELQEYSRNFSSQARSGFIDTSTVDFHSAEFKQLPLETQYQLLNMARLKSRLRMGYTAEELEQMFPNEMDFSRFQINRVAQRNFFTQRLMNLVGLEADLTHRVSSEKNKEYMLKRNDEGWTLSLEDSSRMDQASKPSSDTIDGDKVKQESSDDEFEDVDIQPEDEPAEEPTEESTKAIQSEPTIDLSAEDSAQLDELFGFEAKLSREDLYNKMMQEVDSAEGQSDPTTKTKEWKPRSFLFGSSGTNKPALDKSSASQRALSSKSGARVSEERAQTDERNETTEQPRAPLPWFEQTENNFEEMRIQSTREDPHLVPYEEAANYSEEDEDSFESIDISNEQQPTQGIREENRDELVSPGPSTGITEAGPDAASTHHEEPLVSGDSATLVTEEIPGKQERMGNQAGASSDTMEPGQAKEMPAEPSAEPSAEHIDTAPTEFSKSSSITEPTTFIDSGERAESIGLSDSARAETPEAAVSTEHEPIERSQFVQAEAPEAAVSTEPTRSESVVDLSPGKNGEGEVTEIEPVEFSPEAAERAEEEAKAKVDEDEEIAGMLIAEAEENERFAKELAEQNHKAWTEADQLDYNNQISTLRKQFAKETRDADNVTQEMVQECQELLQFFGIPYITAPGEAEAQCAELRHLNLVDGVVTDDGDTFLFDDDAVVYRNMFSQSRFVECYTTKQISTKLGLNRRRLIDLAFLLGSDYTEGVLGIGPVTSVEILAEFGSLEEFASWWNEAQRFPDNVGLETPLRRRLFKQFRTKLFLPEEFPSKAVVEAYLHPTVDKDSTEFKWGVPDIDGLRKFMNIAAGWSTEKINMALLPVVQEAKRRELQRKTGSAMPQSRLDDYYSTVVQNPEVLSKRAAKATTTLRKRAKK